MNTKVLLAFIIVSTNFSCRTPAKPIPYEVIKVTQAYKEIGEVLVGSSFSFPDDFEAYSNFNQSDSKDIVQLGSKRIVKIEDIKNLKTDDVLTGYIYVHDDSNYSVKLLNRSTNDLEVLAGIGKRVQDYIDHFDTLKFPRICLVKRCISNRCISLRYVSRSGKCDREDRCLSCGQLVPDVPFDPTKFSIIPEGPSTL